MTPWRIGILICGVFCGLQAATQLTAWSFAYAAPLGPAWRVTPDVALYPPWRFLAWRSSFGAEAPRLFAAASLCLPLGAALGAMLSRSAEPARRRRGWGTLAEARRAGLRDNGGCIVGELGGRLLATEDLRPTLVTGGTRSGKGRGHVVPTLLSWRSSVLAHDPKGELWRITAGWRASFSHALAFVPRDPASACWNPLAEIRPGAGELAQVQRLVAILADPAGARNDEAIWDKAASEILEAVILHVLYTAEDPDKTLLKVRDLLADLDATAAIMLRTLHRVGPDGAAQVHPFVHTAAQGYCAMHDRFRTSVQGTARSYLKWLAGEDLERALSTSDFALGDLMCAEAPVSLYLQIAPADTAALRPLARLLIYAVTQALTLDETADGAGRPKRRNLLLLMDEFPLLGRIEFFEKSLRLMSGYGIKAMFAAQSLNDIVETYGPRNTVLDNCFVFTAFAALDPLTQETVSKLTGAVAERRVSRSRLAGLDGGRTTLTESLVDRPLLDPGEIRSLGDEEQLIFVAGRRPFRTRKVKYDRRTPFRQRANVPPPDQSALIDAPARVPHPWAGRRRLGETAEVDSAGSEGVDAALAARRAAGRAADAYEQRLTAYALEQATLDHLQGVHHAKP